MLKSKQAAAGPLKPALRSPGPSRQEARRRPWVRPAGAGPAAARGPRTTCFRPQGLLGGVCGQGSAARAASGVRDPGCPPPPQPPLRVPRVRAGHGLGESGWRRPRSSEWSRFSPRGLRSAAFASLNPSHFQASGSRAAPSNKNAAQATEEEIGLIFLMAAVANAKRSRSN